MDIELNSERQNQKSPWSTSVDLSPPHTPPLVETPLLLSLGKRLECRKGENILKGKEGRRWGALNVCVCVQSPKITTTKGIMRGTHEYPLTFMSKRKCRGLSAKQKADGEKKEEKKRPKKSTKW